MPASAYQEHLGRVAAYDAAESRSGRDILSNYPLIANVRRRSRCRKSLKTFCEVYNPAAFALAWSDDHLKAIARIEEAITLGALYAYALPRGSGKTTLLRMAALWAISYAHRRYVFAIGANAGKAEDTLSAVKTWVRFLPEYAADFPEISHPANRLGGIAQRAGGQLCGGQPTLIEWGKDRVVLATMPPPENWPRSWPLRSDGMVPTSGSVVSASGLTGDGIRGSLLTLSTGETLRPDVVLLDDPQTAESSASPSQNVTRERLISADVLGMAGPGKSISAMMACTVINQDDMVDRLLNRSLHPSWRGERTKLLRSMPADLDAWERYREVWARCALREPPDFAEANAYYVEHRTNLDAGAEASWPERKLPAEVSAVQHAMHLYLRDKVAFLAEYQNDPLPLVPPEPGELKADEVAARVNRTPRGVVPPGMSRLTAFIDVQQDLLYWGVCAWREDFGGSLVAWGSWPEQRKPYYTLADANPTLAQATGVLSVEGAIYAGLVRLTDELLGREWPTEGGGGLRIERLLVDAGWQAEVVRRFCRQSAHAALIHPSKGMPLGAAHVPMDDWPRQQGERRGNGWVLRPPKPGEGRLLLFDANSWKSTLAAKLRQPLGEATAFTLYGTSASEHRLLADHVCAEYQTKTFGRGREVTAWQLRPHRPDNHGLDVLAGCMVAASFIGIEPLGVPKKQQRERKRVSYSDLQNQAKARAGR